ncbi:hypothetical protein [Chryseobacterium caseinilyticum]|uniref:Uncharacterized protein n=1 Tax=Chryseobacterium caseinilyticum TaxID=2771428 RepID=A0ABR8ZFH4_9FLAO|nr:hypothetical protein [Chryseobacterium caseinilyticum]MBD8084046.1 hypothetical protein [Chryseobacterium caseinilyticum]
MKTKILLTLFALFVMMTSMSAQESFKSYELSMIQDILINSSKSSVKKLLKNYDYKFNSTEPADGGTAMHFQGSNNKFVAVFFDESDQIDSVILYLPTNLVSILEADLKNLNFKSSPGDDSNIVWEKRSSDLWCSVLEVDRENKMSAITMSRYF